MNTVGAPIITEKSSQGFSLGTYLIQVSPKSTKQQIARDVKTLYGVDVIDVRVVNLPAKEKTFKRVKGIRPARHRAYIRLKKGQSMPGLELPKESNDKKQEK